MVSGAASSGVGTGEGEEPNDGSPSIGYNPDDLEAGSSASSRRRGGNDAGHKKTVDSKVVTTVNGVTTVVTSNRTTSKFLAGVDGDDQRLTDPAPTLCADGCFLCTCTTSTRGHRCVKRKNHHVEECVNLRAHKRTFGMRVISACVCGENNHHSQRRCKK